MTETIDAADYAAMQDAEAKRGTSKYRNEKVWIDGKRFDSKAEGARYWELRQLEQAGEIRDLECQPRFPLLVQGVKIGEYRADFRYVTADGASTVEDVKGMKTPLYKWKVKHVAAQYGIDVVEIVNGKAQ